MPEFTYRVRHQGAGNVVEVSGDIDMSVHQQLTEALEPLVAAGDVVLDCSRVSFMDSMGLRVALSMVRQAEEVGTIFALVPSKAVSRVLELAGVTEIFNIRDAVPSAAE